MFCRSTVFVTQASTYLVGISPKRATVVSKATSQFIQAIVTPSNAWAHFYVTSDRPRTAAAGARRISDRTSTVQTRLCVSKIPTFSFTCNQARSPYCCRLDLYRASLSSRREAHQRKVCTEYRPCLQEAVTVFVTHQKSACHSTSCDRPQVLHAGPLQTPYHTLTRNPHSTCP